MQRHDDGHALGEDVERAGAESRQVVHVHDVGARLVEPRAQHVLGARVGHEARERVAAAPPGAHAPYLDARDRRVPRGVGRELPRAIQRERQQRVPAREQLARDERGVHLDAAAVRAPPRREEADAQALGCAHAPCTSSSRAGAAESSPTSSA